MSYIDGIWGHHSLPYSMLNPGLPAKHHGHKPINQYTCDYCIERWMFTSNRALQIHISTLAGCCQRKLVKMANYSGTEPQKNFSQVWAKRHELPDVGAELIYDPHMLDDPLDDPGDTCQPEVAPSDLDTGSDLGNVSDDSDRPGSGNNEPEDSDPMQKTMYLIPRITHCIIYMIFSVQWVLSSNLGWREGHGPTWQQRHRGWHPSGVWGHNLAILAHCILHGNRRTSGSWCSGCVKVNCHNRKLIYFCGLSLSVHLSWS